MNKIIDTDKSKCGKLIEQMIEEMNPPKDVEKQLQTSQFLMNRFAPSRDKENVLQPVQKEHGKIYW